MFMHRSGPSLCDSRSTSYFDRPTARISRYRSDDSYTSTTPSTMSMTRKRPRVDSSHYNTLRTPRPSTSTSAHHLDASTSSFGLASPSPLANTDYHLFGGLDTPGTWSEQREERARIEDAELDYRPNRCTTNPSSDQSFFSDLSITNKSQDDSNTDMTASTTLSGWHLRRTAWALTGGLAGKIFNFCWNTTFRGFQAGGGQSYTIHEADNTDFAQDGHRFDPSRSPRTGHQSRESLSGDGSKYQNQQYIDDRAYQNRDRNHDYSSHDPLRTPRTYSRHTSIEDYSALKNNWVFVETSPRSPNNEDHSPVRKRSRASMASPVRSYTQSYQSSIPQPMASSTSRTYTASFASPRAMSRKTSISSRTHSYNSGFAHTRTNSYTNTNPYSTNGPGTTSPLPSPNPKRPRISMTSTSQSHLTSPTKSRLTNTALTQNGAPPSPISPELETFQRKRRKEAKRNDESLRRLNAQLQDMIREGQEALGSRIEVFEYGELEGLGMGGLEGDESEGEEEDGDRRYFRD